MPKKENHIEWCLKKINNVNQEKLPPFSRSKQQYVDWQQYEKWENY